MQNTSNQLIEKYYSLNGKTITRQELSKLHIAFFDALPEENNHLIEIWHKLGDILYKYPKAQNFKLTITATTNEMLNGIPFMQYDEVAEKEQLGKAVTPEDIYSYITEVIINTIEKVGHLPWQREWEKTSLYNGYQALNYDTKKGYRGINYFMLNFEVKYKDGQPYLTPRNLENPYFLTFASIERHGGKLKKGAKGNRVVYFTKLYVYSEQLKNGKELRFATYDQKKFKAWLTKNYNKLKHNGWSIERLSNVYIPILKYYNVFNAADITGIDFKKIPKNTNVNLPEKQRIEIAEKIVKNMPNAPLIKFGGDQPAYYPTTDHVLMTPIEAFNNEQSYYSTLFHELTHSTGHKKRLNRFNNTKSTKKEYAFEELIAELGAVFLSAESGILFSTINNSAKYLNGWNKALVANMKKDNKYFFRASSKSQASADYILDRDTNGVPKYLKDKSKPTGLLNKEKKDKKATKIAKSKPTGLFVLNNLPKKYEKQIFNSNVEELKRFLKAEDDILNVASQNMIDLVKNKHFILLNFKKGYLRNSKAPVYKNVPTYIFNRFYKKDINNLSLDQLKFILDRLKDYEYNTAWNEYSFNGKDVFEINKTIKYNISAINRFLKVDTKPISKNKVIGYALVDNITGEIVASKKELQQLQWFYEKNQNKDFKDLDILAYEVIQIGNKKKLGKKIKLEKNTSKTFVDDLFNDIEKVDKKTRQVALFGGKKKPVTKVKTANDTSTHKGVEDVSGPFKNTLNPVNVRSSNKEHEYYKITGDIAKLLGNVEIKPKDSVAITLDAPQGSGKTRVFFQIINEFASKGYKILFVSPEEHPESAIFQEKLDQYIKPENQTNVYALDITNYNEISRLIPQFDIVLFDSWNKIAEKNKGIDFDNDLRKKFDSKLFIAIFQRTVSGTMRGGSKAQFDGDIILKIVKNEDFKDNYVIADKNRYQKGDIHEIKYNIYYKKLVSENEIEENPKPSTTNDRIIITV